MSIEIVPPAAPGNPKGTQITLTIGPPPYLLEPVNCQRPSAATASCGSLVRAAWGRCMKPNRISPDEPSLSSR